MDSFAIHPYQDNSSTPPGFAHPNNTTIAIADYDKLVTLLGQAFDGTQPGSTLPIVYGEFGVESVIPSTKSSVYTGEEIESARPVDNATQARFYREPPSRWRSASPTSRRSCSPHRRRVEPRPLAVGDVLRGRHSEAEPDRGRGGRRDARGGVIGGRTGLSLLPVAKVSYPRASR